MFQELVHFSSFHFPPLILFLPSCGLPKTSVLIHGRVKMNPGFGFQILITCLFFSVILFLAVGFECFEGPGPETQSSYSAISHYKEIQKQHKMDLWVHTVFPLKGLKILRPSNGQAKHSVVQGVEFLPPDPKMNSKGTGDLT